MTWKKIQTGVYEMTDMCGTEFRIVRGDEIDKPSFWVAYGNGKHLGTSRTLAKAKERCKVTVKIKVTIDWGRQFDVEEGYLKPTPGVGMYVTVEEVRGNSFTGCPLGRGNSVEAALIDFVRRGRPEIVTAKYLHLGMLEMVEQEDRRDKVLVVLGEAAMAGGA